MMAEGRGRRASTAEYLSLHLRVHALLREVPLYDVWLVDLPGGGPGRSVADIRKLEKTAPPSRIAKTLFGVRRWLGQVFGWDRKATRPEDSLMSHLSERDRRDSEIVPGTRDGAFLVLYQFPKESLRETRNATVHGWISLALTPTATGYRLYFAVYVLAVSRLTRPYLIAIEPFRRLLYPAMLNRIRRAWIAAYGGSA
jgi:hypothetical protein